MLDLFGGTVWVALFFFLLGGVVMALVTFAFQWLAVPPFEKELDLNDLILGSLVQLVRISDARYKSGKLLFCINDCHLTVVDWLEYIIGDYCTLECLSATEATRVRTRILQALDEADLPVVGPRTDMDLARADMLATLEDLYVTITV